MALVENSSGDKLEEVLSISEDRLASYAPLTVSLIVARFSGMYLLVFNRGKKHWELPGGLIDLGETARACAMRELAEESGQTSTKLRFRAVASFFLQPDAFNPTARIEFGAVFSCDLEKLNTFTPSGEISRIILWDMVSDIGLVDPIDRKLLEYY